MAMTLRPEPAHEAALTRLAAHWGVSKQQAALRAILEEAQRVTYLDEVRELTGQVQHDWADLLERLAQ